MPLSYDARSVFSLFSMKYMGSCPLNGKDKVLLFIVKIRLLDNFLLNSILTAQIIRKKVFCAFYSTHVLKHTIGLHWASVWIN